MRKSQDNNKHFFYFYFFIKKNLNFVRKYIWKSLIYIVKSVLKSFFCVEGSWKYGNKTPTFTKICIGLVDAVLLPKIFGNRLGILT